jgi:NADH-quinone oxidoreductase subunit H
MDTAKLFTDYGWAIFGVIKIAIMLGFFLNIAPVAVWVERRQAALIQDRLGPNRALITVPGILLKGALATPALLAAAGVAYVSFNAFPPRPPVFGVERGFWMSELAVFLAWTHLLILASVARRSEAIGFLEDFLAKMEDPRWIFYTGLIGHVTLAVAYGGLSGDVARAAARNFAFAGPISLIAVLGGAALYMGWRMPDGPVELRLGGLFHSIADAMKVVWKEDFIPPNADKLLHSLAPLIALFPALVTFAVIPFGDTLCVGATNGLLDVGKIASTAPDLNGVCADGGFSMQIADLNVGILFMFAIAGTGIVGAAIAGWSSDNKWSLLGGLRAASQMVSYEVAMGLSLVGAFMVYGSPRLGDMVRWQQNNAWGLFVQPLAFFLFFAAAIAEQKRTPFDAPEGESEIIAGYFVEYSSFKFLMFLTGEYLELVISSAVLVTVFLGGWTLPFFRPDGIHVMFGETLIWHSPISPAVMALLSVVVFFGKVVLLTFGQIFIRWTVPRFRYDQIMAFGWKMLLPAAIANLVITGIGVLLAQGASAPVQATLRILAHLSHAVVVAAVAYLAIRFVLLLLSPIERKKFTKSATAVRAARLGGVKEEAMGA